MRVLIVNTLYYPYKIGGAEVSVQLLAEELTRKGHQVRVVCLHHKKEKKIDVINSVEVIYLPLKNIYWPFSDGRKGTIKRLLWHFIDNYNILMANALSKEIDEFIPDVVHTNNIAGFSVAIWAEIKKRKIKLVHTSRDYYLFHPNSILFSKNKNMEPDEKSVKLWSFAKKIASKKVDIYIGISDYIRRFHTENGFFTRASTNYIYNAVEKLPVAVTSSESLRFGFIGRLTKDKGFDDYCQLVEKIRQRYPNTTFCAAGRFANYKDEKELQALATERNIELHGFIPVNEFLAKVDVVVLPIKWREPFGRVVVESAMANKIVLTNPVGGISELNKLFSKIYFLDQLDEIDLLKNKPGNANDGLFTYSEIASRYINEYKS
ncbi:glycosyltransferase family 4 protein [Serratia marcescens]|uniref:glycosyltransferase family 4 protein n=1 Tax=Serratia marcescens TaxID=615 RepID=UPI003ED8C376